MSSAQRTLETLRDVGRCRNVGLLCMEFGVFSLQYIDLFDFGFYVEDIQIRFGTWFGRQAFLFVVP